MNSQFCAERAYVGLRVSVWRSKFSSPYVLRKIMALLTPPFQKTGLLILLFWMKYCLGELRKGACLPGYFWVQWMSGTQRTGRLSDGRVVLPDSEVLASVISGVGQGTTLIPRHELPLQQIAPSLWILAVPSSKLRKKTSKGKAQSLCLQVLLMLWSLWACNRSRNW